LLDIDLKIILLDHQNNFVGTLKIISNAPKNFYILFDSFNKITCLYSAKILDFSVNLFFFANLNVLVSHFVSAKACVSV